MHFSAPNALGGTNRQEQTVMPLGDSITLGYPGNVGGWRAPLIAAHPLLLSVGTQDDGTGVLRSKKFEGVGGRNSNDILTGIPTWYAAWPADIVLLQIGTNDLTGYPTPLYTPSQYATNVVGSINAIRVIKPQARIFLGKLPYPKLGIYPQSAIDMYRAALSAALSGLTNRTNVTEVDFPQMPDANFADALHPSAAGYTSMAATWDAALTAAGY